MHALGKAARHLLDTTVGRGFSLTTKQFVERRLQ
jgi:hypothetical protein